jgi:hypothetical protein
LLREEVGLTGDSVAERVLAALRFGEPACADSAIELASKRSIG